MRFYYILIIAVFFVCCSQKKKDVSNIDPKNINVTNQINKDNFNESSVVDIPLIFVLGEYNLKKEADIDTISTNETNLDNIIYEHPVIGINYSFDYKPESNSFTDRSFELKADNGKNFTVRELLYKINQHKYNDLSKEDHYILEGLQYCRYSKK